MQRGKDLRERKNGGRERRESDEGEVELENCYGEKMQIVRMQRRKEKVKIKMLKKMGRKDFGLEKDRRMQGWDSIQTYEENEKQEEKEGIKKDKIVGE